MRAFLVLLAVTLVNSYGHARESNQNLTLIPTPQSVQLVPQHNFQIGNTLNVCLRGPKEERANFAVRDFFEKLPRLAGVTAVKPNFNCAHSGLHIEWSEVGLPVQSDSEDESYQLTVTSKNVTLYARNPLGVLRGLQTLLQLVKTQPGPYFQGAQIQDKPRFAWRGLLLDPARHFLPMETLHRVIDGMYAVKLNVLHLHLSDDQGFRVESSHYPGLMTVGSRGQYYTQAELREFVTYSRMHGVRVVPEFDVPGHTRSWAAAYPQIGSSITPVPLLDCFLCPSGSALDPSKPEVYQFLQNFFSEVAGLFPDEYIHIGGDEVDGDVWQKNPNIAAFMKANNFATSAELHVYFNQKIISMIKGFGKKLMGWDEIVESGLNAKSSLLIQSWRGESATVDSLNKGFKVVVSADFYLDLLMPSDYHYAFDPVPAGASPDQAKNVLGGEAALWGEFVTAENVESRLWPRTAALAERFWSPTDVRDRDDLYRRLLAQSRRFETIGLHHRLEYETALANLSGGRNVTAFRNLADALIPLRFLSRNTGGNYTVQSPMNRMADLVLPETDVLLHFEHLTRNFLTNGSDARALLHQLDRWIENENTLRPYLIGRSDLTELVPVSHNLAAAAMIGRTAVEYIVDRKVLPSGWKSSALAQLAELAKPVAEVQNGIADNVKKLVEASQ